MGRTEERKDEKLKGFENIQDPGWKTKITAENIVRRISVKDQHSKNQNSQRIKFYNLSSTKPSAKNFWHSI